MPASCAAADVSDRSRIAINFLARAFLEDDGGSSRLLDEAVTARSQTDYRIPAPVLAGERLAARRGRPFESLRARAFTVLDAFIRHARRPRAGALEAPIPTHASLVP
ncbi:MAG: hypothetical protein QF554_05355 [Dehalococcoidia bacterium]|nr:hypothetical protein [Dehalococcoidia bacterium]